MKINEYKDYEGLYDSIYKKFELYLFRLFQLAKYVENFIKFTRISGPELSEVLNPNGCDKLYVRIPPNPFIVSENDLKLFRSLFDPLPSEDESDKGYKKLFVEIWRRIAEIKEWVGITKNTQFYGEPVANSRLVNELDVYLKFPSARKPLYLAVFGEVPNDPKEKKAYLETIKQFKNFLLDREKHNDAKSYQNYC